MKNYRQEIMAIAARYDTCANEDWARALLEGAPNVITAEDALEIARWLETDAAIAWNADDEALYDRIAAEIRAAVAKAQG